MELSKTRHSGAPLDVPRLRGALRWLLDFSVLGDDMKWLTEFARSLDAFEISAIVICAVVLSACVVALEVVK